MSKLDWTYNVKIAREGDDFVVTVRDLPEVVTSGDTLEQALEFAADAIDVVVAHRIEKSKNLPLPSPAEPGEHPVALSAQAGAKASVYAAWLQSGISKSELARRLNLGETQARRLLNLRHGSSLAAMDEAAHAMGWRLVVSAEKVA